MSVKTPNFFLAESHTYYANGHGGDGKILPYGASVRPIDPKYVPEHVKDKFRSFDPKTDVFVYCRYGIIVIPKHLIQEK